MATIARSYESMTNKNVKFYIFLKINAILIFCPILDGLRRATKYPFQTLYGPISSCLENNTI